MIHKTLRGGWAVIILLLALLLALHLMSNAVQDAEGLSRLFVPLLGFTIGGLVIMVVLILVDSVRLWREYKANQAGSRLTLRMLVIFLLLALPPVALVYYYSQDIFLEGIDSWFDVNIVATVEDALSLSQASIDLHRKEKLRITAYLWQGLQDSSQTALALGLDELREAFDVQELLLVNFRNEVVASSSVNPTQILFSPPESEVVRQVRNGENFVSIEPASDGGLMVRTLMADPKGRPLLLQARFRTSELINQLTAKVQNSVRRYRELAYLRDSLKFSFGLVLILVLSYALVTAIWAAFFSARRLVAPVAQIANGTREIALGNYDQQLPIPENRDELGFLVASFNAMARSIALARDQAKHSQQEVESQRSYLSTVLGRLSSGVMTFDSRRRICTANPAAELILRVPLEPLYGAPLNQLAEDRPALIALTDALIDPLTETEEWRSEVTIIGAEGRQTLLCSLSPMTEPGGAAAGHVLVFDEITTLLQAQKDAAWGGIARRLAHEIKNPLTPIQLSAERMRLKLKSKLPEAEAQILERATHTIIQQVDTMKEMVNAFSEYARPPKIQLETLNFDVFINEALDLYRLAGTGPELSVMLDTGNIKIQADPNRIRQVVVNLVKNAQEALEGIEHGHIQIMSRLQTLDNQGYLELEVRDNGPGFNPEVLEHLFEPYITSKVKGTGLGLAIVKKIIEEHGGIIRAENLPGTGAHIIIQLPLLEGHTSRGVIEQ
jgi:nitrogen fixation/metabolism regulation signal transduction histidine kinase